MAPKVVRKPTSSGPVLERHPMESAQVDTTYDQPGVDPKANDSTGHTSTTPALVDTSGQIDYVSDSDTVRTDPRPALVDTSMEPQEPSVEEYRAAGYTVSDDGRQIKADSATPPGEVRLVEHYSYGVNDGLTANERAEGMKPRNPDYVEVIGTVVTEVRTKNISASPSNKAASPGADK